MLVNVAVKMKKKASVCWLLIDAGFQFGSTFDDVLTEEGYLVVSR